MIEYLEGASLPYWTCFPMSDVAIETVVEDLEPSTAEELTEEATAPLDSGYESNLTLNKSDKKVTSGGNGLENLLLLRSKT